MEIPAALCRLCLEKAPNLITYNRDEIAVHFFTQPETPEETDAAQRERRMKICDDQKSPLQRNTYDS